MFFYIFFIKYIFEIYHKKGFGSRFTNLEFQKLRRTYFLHEYLKMGKD